MADAGFFRGTSAAQDNRFSDKEKKMMKQMKFADILLKKVDMPRVKLDVIKPWITRRVTEMLGSEDEVLVEFVFNQLEEKNLNPRKMQINLTGFLNGRNARLFMQELWDLLCSASANPSGIPDSFIEQKKEEIKKRNEDQAREEQMIRRQLEAERDRVERQLSCAAVRRSRSPPREERRQRRRSRTPAEEATGPATDSDGHRRDGLPGAAAAAEDPALLQTDSAPHGRSATDGPGRSGKTGTETGEGEEDAASREEAARRRRNYRSNKLDSHDADKKVSSRGRRSRSHSRSRESRWNRSRSAEDRRSRSRERHRSRSRSRSREPRRSRSRSRERHRSRSRSREPRRSRSRDTRRSRSREPRRSRSRDNRRSRSRDNRSSRSREPHRSRSRSREPRRQSEKQSRRKSSPSGPSPPRSRRSPRRRSSSREKRRRTEKRFSAAGAVSPADREERGSRPAVRRLNADDRQSRSTDRASKKKRRSTGDQEPDVDKNKDKKKKKKKHSKKHKKHKSRKGSVSKDNAPADTKDARSQLDNGGADGSADNEPPLWRGNGAVLATDGVLSSEERSADAADSSPEPEDGAASPGRRGAARGCPQHDSEEDSESAEDGQQDLEALERKLRERALRSMQRRQASRAPPPAARDSSPRSSPRSSASSADSD